MLDLWGEWGVLGRGLGGNIFGLLFDWGWIKGFVGKLVVVIKDFFFYL